MAEDQNNKENTTTSDTNNTSEYEDCLLYTSDAADEL